MTPDSAVASLQRRAWRFMSALGCVLGAASILLTAIKWTGTDTRQDRQAVVATRAICSIVAYAESASDRARFAADDAPTPDLRARSLQAHESLEMLAGGMRKTGISCPSRRPPHR